MITYVVDVPQEQKVDPISHANAHTDCVEIFLK